MNPKFKKLALAASISAGLGAAAMPAHAMILGEAGEALLIPWVQWGDDNGTKMNTYISVQIPDVMGFDTIPNVFTAPNTTPTNPGPALFPPDTDLGNFGQYINGIHWYWFDYKSVHRLNRYIPVSPNYLAWIDWEAVSGPSFEDEPGYMIIGTEAARTGQAADFSMFGEAWIEMYTDDPYGSMVPIPVLPMNDGADGAFDSPVSVADQVKYGPGGIPRAASPLYSGIRTNRSDGVLNDTTVFNMSLGDRNFPSINVVWLDVNLDEVLDNEGLGLLVDVWDSMEHTCSDSVDLPWELNVIYVAPWWDNDGFDPYGNEYDREYCIPNGAGYVFGAGFEYHAFAEYYIPEYIDTNINLPESAAVAFSIIMDWDSEDQLRYTSSGAQPRGTFK
jgi:hypothetical protein